VPQKPELKWCASAAAQSATTLTPRYGFFVSALTGRLTPLRCQGICQSLAPCSIVSMIRFVTDS
jgi:hypothetical protein